MAFSLDDVVISLVELRIGFFEECGPKLDRVFALAEYPFVLRIHRQLIIDDDVELLGEFEKSDHVGTFAVGPSSIAIAVVPDCFFDEFLAQNCEWAD